MPTSPCGTSVLGVDKDGPKDDDVLERRVHKRTTKIYITFFTATAQRLLLSGQNVRPMYSIHAYMYEAP